jgi:hypothetical protein
MRVFNLFVEDKNENLDDVIYGFEPHENMFVRIHTYFTQRDVGYSNDMPVCEAREIWRDLVKNYGAKRCN